MIYIELVISRKYIKIADKVDQSHKKEPKIELSPYLRGHGRYKSSVYPYVPSQIQSLVLCIMREPREYSLRACRKMPNNLKVDIIFVRNIIISCQILRFRAIISKYTYKRKYPHLCFEYFEQHSFNDTCQNSPLNCSKKISKS